jgi:hypothetical protein
MCEWATTGMISSRQETRRGEWEASERSVVQCSAVRSALSLFLGLFERLVEP